MALTESPTLSEYSGFVQDSGEGRWTIQAAFDEAVPVDVLSAGPVCPLPSRQEHTLRRRLLRRCVRNSVDMWSRKAAKKRPREFPRHADQPRR